MTADSTYGHLMDFEGHEGEYIFMRARDGEMPCSRYAYHPLPPTRNMRRVQARRRKTNLGQGVVVTCSVMEVMKWLPFFTMIMSRRMARKFCHLEVPLGYAIVSAAPAATGACHS